MREVEKDLVNLLGQLLQENPDERLTAKQLLKDPWLVGKKKEKGKKDKKEKGGDKKDKGDKKKDKKEKGDKKEKKGKGDKKEKKEKSDKSEDE